MGCGQWEAGTAAGALPWEARDHSNGPRQQWEAADHWLSHRGGEGKEGKYASTVFDGLPPQVWNYMSTQCVKQMSVCGEGGCGGGGEEVTGILHLMGKFLTVGWNRRITTFPDVPDVRREEEEEGVEGWNKFVHELETYQSFLRYLMSGRMMAGRERTITRYAVC